MKGVMVKNIISEFGWFGTLRMCIWREIYRIGYRNKKIKKIYIKTVDHFVYFRPYTTDILLLLNLFCRPLNDGGMEYKLDFLDFISPVNNIIDAGANIGLFTIIYQKLYPSAKFICIEPDIDNYKVLKKNMERYGNVECIWGGVWKRDSYLRILDRGTGEWGFSVEECEEVKGDCPGYSVKSILGRLHSDNINIFKMDIEGSEEDVFEEDYEDWIENVQCYIIETHDRIRPGVEKKILRIFSSYGFVNKRNGENIVFYKE